MRRLSLLALLVVVALVTACESVGYYAQSVTGHLSIMARRAPIEKLVRAPETPPLLRKRLERAVAIRQFAAAELLLPDSGSYRTYVDIERPFVVWNVVAAPEFSLEPSTWCFPFVGCVGYRGYFAEGEAREYAKGLEAQGLDAYVGGARAYSTLGWFDDPLLNTVLEQPPHYVASIIFHELAHQRLYVPGDSSFNEAFAVAVEREGVRRWLLSEASSTLQTAYSQTQQRKDDFLSLVNGARERLQALYASALPVAEMRARKAEILAALREQYATTKRSWDGFAGYDRWFGTGLNNAKLALVATYHHWVPAFDRMLADEGGDLQRFYRACEALAQLSPVKRAAKLDALLEPRQQTAQGNLPQISPHASSAG